MSNLETLIKHGPDKTRLIGTYLYPYRIFGDPDWNDAYSVTEIIKTIEVDTISVLLTRNGGLFVQPQGRLLHAMESTNIIPEDLNQILSFQSRVAHAFNRLICEFALHGIVSEPATPVHFGAGNMYDNHAVLTVSGGGREKYPERTQFPVVSLLQGTWVLYPQHKVEIVETVSELRISSNMVTISENLPTFVAATYSLFSQQQNAEALVDSWIAVEQIIDWLWSSYISGLGDTSRESRLRDPRTYSAAVRIEVLHTAGIIHQPLYTLLNAARKHRNDLAHRANVNLDKTKEAVLALKELIEFVCSTQIEPPLPNEGFSW